MELVARRKRNTPFSPSDSLSRAQTQPATPSRRDSDRPSGTLPRPDIGCRGPDIEARDPISGTRYRVTLDIGVHNFDIEDRDPISGQHIGSRYRSLPISKITHFDIGVRYRSIPISKYLNFDIGSCNFDIGFFGFTYRTRYRRSILTFDIEDHQLRYRRSISYAISGAISDGISDTISYTI